MPSSIAVVPPSSLNPIYASHHGPASSLPSSLLPRLLNPLLPGIHGSLPLGLLCHLLVCLRIFLPQVSFASISLEYDHDRNDEKRTSLLLLSERYLIFVHILLFFLGRLEGFGFAA